MTDRPILFSAPMVRALLDGRKTQTRRCGKRDFLRSGIMEWNGREMTPVPSYAPGDRLWVREAWRAGTVYDDLTPSEMGGEEGVRYEADGAAGSWTFAVQRPGRLRPARFMPRWASRLTLTVTDVRVQRVQEIDGEDALAEGIAIPRCGCEVCARSATMCPADASEACMAFAQLWDSLNAARGHGWDANPWVVALTFTVARRNIDAPEAAA